MKFGNLLSDNVKFKNIGEDMQIFAIDYLYEKMGISGSEIIRIPVSQLRTYSGEFVILPINYPFYGNLTLSSRIIPVYLGLSILSGEVSDSLQLKKYEPVGCRDVHTFKELSKRGIDAYVGGCLTITLPYQNPDYQNNVSIYIVDAPQNMMHIIPEKFKRNAVYKTHVFFNETISEAESKKLYQEYVDNAKLVITSKLHCAVPCLAAGLPVVFLCEKKSFRLDWLENIIPIYTLNDYQDINWTPQPIKYEKEKELIINHAIRRIRETFYRYRDTCAITSLYLTSFNLDYTLDSLENVKKFVEDNWEAENSYDYILWGITQTTEIVYDYLCTHYPQARLYGIIDLFHPQYFKGVKTSDYDLLNGFKGVVFVTAESVNHEAKKIALSRPEIKCVLCWDR